MGGAQGSGPARALAVALTIGHGCMWRPGSRRSPFRVLNPDGKQKWRTGFTGALLCAMFIQWLGKGA